MPADHLVSHCASAKPNETFFFLFFEGDSLGLTVLPEYELAVHALGGLTWYLCDSQLDMELLSMRSFEEYVPIDRAVGEVAKTNEKSKTPAFITARQHMVCMYTTNV